MIIPNLFCRYNRLTKLINILSYSDNLCFLCFFRGVLHIFAGIQSLKMLNNEIEYFPEAAMFHGHIPLIMGTKLDLIAIVGCQHRQRQRGIVDRDQRLFRKGNRIRRNRRKDHCRFRKARRQAGGSRGQQHGLSHWRYRAVGAGRRL